MADTPTEPLPPPQQAYVPTSADYVEGDHPTDNPDGVTVSNVDYIPKTQEEKAAMIRVPFAETSEVEPTEPYPEGNGWAETYDENFYQAHGYRREGKSEPPENEPEPPPVPPDTDGGEQPEPEPEPEEET